MYSQEWQTSQREYGVKKQVDVAIPVDDGDVLLAADIYLPDGKDEPSPAIVGAHAYNKEFQGDAPVKHSAVGLSKGWIESGDPNFYVRRGYALVNINVRGSGRSTGDYLYGARREAEDVRDAIEWIADQPWCDGSVGMLGISYYAVNQQQVAMLDPEPLECLFAPWGWTDWYRDMAYHGGILCADWITGWPLEMDNIRPYSEVKAKHGEKEFQQRIDEALRNEEIVAHEGLVEALRNPNQGTNAHIVDVVLHALDDEYWHDRTVHYEHTDIPAYLGADWGMYGFHLQGAPRSWHHWEGPKKLLIGPPVFVDRPFYQLAYESLRWFDYWLKDVDTGIMDEPPISLFIPDGRDEEGRPTGDWTTAEDWPLEGTKWTPFYLHDDGLLSEHEIFPGPDGGGTDHFVDSPFEHEELWYETPKIVEPTTICGPIRLNLYASSTAEEEFFFITLYDVAPDGSRDEITRGWLRGSHRAVDESQSTPWYAFHPHDEREPLTPGEVHEFPINLVLNARRFPTGHRIGLRIKGSDADEEPFESLRGLALGKLENQTASRVTVHRTNDYPSHLLLPVTHGNRLEIPITGGLIPSPPVGPFPVEKIHMPKDPVEAPE